MTGNKERVVKRPPPDSNEHRPLVVHHNHNGHADGEARQIDPRRAEIVAAMASLVGQRGYSRASIAQIADHAHVSRSAFYELFSDRHDCFLAAFEEASSELRELAVSLRDEYPEWQARTRAILTAVLAAFDERPATARLLVVEPAYAGERVLRRRTELIAQIAVTLQEWCSEVEPHSAPPLNIESVLSAVAAVIEGRLLDNDRNPLIELVNPLMAMIMLALSGPDAAAAELARPAPRRRPASRQKRDPFLELGLRSTPTTVAVLRVIAATPGASNREIAEHAGITDPGQISRLLWRLEQAGVIRHDGRGITGGRSNEWTLTPRGAALARSI